MGIYREAYEYDEVSNFLRLLHQGTDPHHAGWKREYRYHEPSLLDPAQNSNRLSSTRVGEATETYAYDIHGNMLQMPHLAEMVWDFKDQLQALDLGGGGRAYHVYDASGQRVRKVHEHNGSTVEERIYLGGFEIYRKHTSGEIKLERETLHIMDDKQRIALVETRTLDVSGNDPAPEQLIRFQFGNHLGSASLELDHQAQIISYEEYSPYGSTSYQAVRSQTAAPKRYRYTGKERDEETGLSYHGARYYATWLARWISADPVDITDDINVFAYVRSNPARFVDETGFGIGDWIYENVLVPTADFIEEHGIDDAVAGFGDTVSFGLTAKVRQAGDFDSSIDYNSSQYKGGQVAGYAHSLAFGGAGIAKSVASVGVKTTVKAVGIGVAGTAATVKVADTIDPSGTTSAIFLNLVAYVLPFASKLFATRTPEADAAAARLKTVIQTGGPSGGKKSIAAAEVNVPGYSGRSTTVRARSGAGTPDPSQQTVPHSPTPADRTLTTSRVSNAPGEHGHSRAVDAEIKVLEQVQAGLPPNAQGTVNLASSNPLCPSCTTAAFEFAGANPGIRLGVFAPSRRVPSLSLLPTIRDLLSVAGVLVGAATRSRAGTLIDTGSGALSTVNNSLVFTPDEDLVPPPIVIGIGGRF